MANRNDFQDAITKLNDAFQNPPQRNNLFGNMLKSVSISNIRGIQERIEFTWPVTAIAGVNGSGKTTFLQISSTAYVMEKGGHYYKVGDWIRGALKGETQAITLPARIGFTFWDDITKSFDVNYLPELTRWNYPKNSSPKRYVDYIGISNFAPRIEKKDRINIFKSRIEIKNENIFDVKITESISRILEVPYTSSKMLTVGISKGDWSSEIPQISRNQISYTEPHMGAGEQKVVRLVSYLESLPPKSLILLEEPELTLHPDAQKGLAWYLMALSRRNGHQIIIATHSQDIFETLPLEGRKLLVKDKNNKSVVLYKVPHFYAARELSKSIRTNKDIIFVEDDKAKCLLLEIFQRFNKKMYENISIIPVGNTDDVKIMVDRFRKEGQRAIGIRDPDIGESTIDYLFSLPGDSCIEKELLNDTNTKEAEKFISGIENAVSLANTQTLHLSGTKKYKEMFQIIPKELGIDISRWTDRIILTWINANIEKIKIFLDKIEKVFEYKIDEQ